MGLRMAIAHPPGLDGKPSMRSVGGFVLPDVLMPPCRSGRHGVAALFFCY
jgi:hypothetical protein